MPDAMLDAVLDQLRRTHDGDPWYGSPRMRFLRDLSPAAAAVRPAGSAHSIWELVLHMTAWTGEVRSRLAGAPPREPSEGDWPAVDDASDPAWREALVRLEEEHAALLRDAASLAPDDLVRPVGEHRDAALDTGLTVGAMLVGLAQHDAYHTGQLALLRRAVGQG